MFPDERRHDGLTLRRLRRAVEPERYLDWAAASDLRAARTRETVLSPAVAPGAVPELSADEPAPYEEGAAVRYAVADEGGLRAAVEAVVRWRLRRADVGLLAPVEAWREGIAGDALDAVLDVALARPELAVAVTGHLSDEMAVREGVAPVVERRDGERAGPFANWVVVDGRPRDLVRYAVRGGDRS